MPTIPLWLIPSKGHVASVTLTPQAVSSGGTLSDGTAVVLTGRLSGLSTNLQSEKAEINTITSSRQNSVIVSDGFSVTVAVLKVNDGTNVDPLITALKAADIFKLSWTEGTVAGEIKTYTLYVSRTSYTANIQGRGEVIAEFSGDSVDVGAADFYKVVTA